MKQPSIYNIIIIIISDIYIIIFFLEKNSRGFRLGFYAFSPT